MKNIVLTISAAVALLCTASCSFFDRTPYTQTSPGNFYKKESDLKLTLVGAYEAMHTTTVAGTSVSGATYFIGLMHILSGPSDEVLTNANASDGYGQCTDFLRSTMSQSTTGVRRLWTMCYAGIDRSNTVLAHLDLAKEPETALHYQAEARFMRAFYYWYLAQNFGGVPIVRFQGDGQEPRSNLADVYAYILDDLQFAYENLPETGGILGTTSANRYTAAAYIARICNYLAACKRSGTGEELLSKQPLNDFGFVDADKCSERARDCCEDIIQNSSYKMIDDWTNLFRETTKSDQHKECLFMAENYISGSENNYPPTGPFGFSPATIASVERGTTGDSWMGYGIPSIRMWEMFSPKDPRRDWFFTASYTGNTQVGTIKVETRDGIRYPRPWYRPANWSKDYSHDDETRQTFAPWVNDQSNNNVGKYRFIQCDQNIGHPKNNHSMSIPLMRMADVYLMYGEAVYFADHDIDKARLQFREVLKRACRLHWNGEDTDYTYYDDESLVDDLMNAYKKDDFVQELLETRERELCFECSRKLDLIRFNLIDEQIDILTNGSPDGNPDHPYDSYWRRFDGSIRTYSSPYHRNGIAALRENWRPFKIWLPISELEISVNKNLTQNAEW